MAQWDNQKSRFIDLFIDIYYSILALAYKPEVPSSTPDSSCFSLVFIKNLINDTSKHKKKNVTICIVLSGAPHCYL